MKMKFFASATALALAATGLAACNNIEEMTETTTDQMESSSEMMSGGNETFTQDTDAMMSEEKMSDSPMTDSPMTDSEMSTDMMDSEMESGDTMSGDAMMTDSNSMKKEGDKMIDGMEMEGEKAAN